MAQSSNSSYTECVNIAVSGLQNADAAHVWPVSERLGAFFFLLLDAIEEAGRDDSDMSDSFDGAVGGVASEFRKSLRSALAMVMDASDIPGVNRLVTETAPVRFVVSELIIQLLSTSVADTTEDGQRSAALADKTIAFAASLLASPVASNAVDLARYSVEAGYLPVDRIPFISEWLGLRPSTSNHGGDDTDE